MKNIKEEKEITFMLYNYLNLDNLMEKRKQELIDKMNSSYYEWNKSKTSLYSNTLEEWVTHRGIDIKGEMGSNIVSIAGGTITSIKNDPRYGLSITIEHDNGLKSIYSCMLSTEDGLEEGVKVSQGQVIGKMGNSGVFETADGSHLHFELIQNGDYINPEMYIK